jgi:hypothetical protein
MEVIYRVKYSRFFVLSWGPLAALLVFGFINKGADFLTLENVSGSRTFGNNYLLLIMSFTVYLYFLARITLKVIGSQGLLLHKSGATLYVYNKPKFGVAQIAAVTFEERYG